MSQDPLSQYCAACAFFDQQTGCQQMIPPAEAASQLLSHCPIPPHLLLERIVQGHLRRKGAESDAPTLRFEVQRAFQGLSAANFQQPGAGARLVISLLRGLTWRQYAALVQRERGRLTPSHCQWYHGVPGQGSACHREAPPAPLDAHPAAASGPGDADAWEPGDAPPPPASPQMTTATLAPGGAADQEAPTWEVAAVEAALSPPPEPALAAPTERSPESSGGPGRRGIWGLGGLASAVGLGLLVWLVLPAAPPEHRVPQVRSLRGLKGQPQWTKGIEHMYADFAARAILHLGVSDGPGLPVRRLRRQSPCRPSQNLFFGFSLADPGGYVYLLRVDPSGQEAPELLYPFAPARPSSTTSGVVHIVQSKGITQRYPLRRERRRVLFVLLQLRRPLSSAQRRWLLRQKRGWREQMGVFARASFARPASFDRWLLRLLPNASGQAPGDAP